MKILNYYNHFSTVMKHKWYVFLACKDCNITRRGIKHDISKFSPMEFFEYADNFVKGKSPVDIAKEKYGYSKAWLHHRGRNDHHYEYWIDNLSSGGTAIKMPYDCVIEMICDQVGASKAYSGDKWTQQSNWNWYQANKDKMLLHKDTRILIEIILGDIRDNGWKNVARNIRHKNYYTKVDSNGEYAYDYYSLQ